MEYLYLATLFIVVVVVLLVRSKLSYYKPIFAEHHYRIVSQWVESVLKKGEVANPTVEDGTAITTDAGISLAFTRTVDDEYDWVQFSISQRKGRTTHAVGGRFMFLILQLLSANKCNADFFYTRSGVHHVVLPKPVGGEWKFGSIEESIQKMSSYHPLPLEFRDVA